MESRQFASLMISLLPRGDCWGFERDSIFTKIVSGLSVEFERIHAHLEEMKEAFFPKSEHSFWKSALLFSDPPQGLFTLSQSSILAQFKFYNIDNVELAAPPDEPFVIYVHINPKEERFLSAGDRVGQDLYHWRDESLEEQIQDILPAFCLTQFIYRSNLNA